MTVKGFFFRVRNKLAAFKRVLFEVSAIKSLKPYGKKILMSAKSSRVLDVVSQSKVIDSLQPNEAIRVVFILQHSSIWSAWRSVWLAAEKDPRFSPQIVLSPFVHPFSSEVLAYDDIRELLIAENVPFTTSQYFDLKVVKPHVVFLQNPYEETRPKHLRVNSLMRSGAKIAYIPYGLEMGGGAWNMTAQFDSELHRVAWRIFARSPRHKNMFARHCAAGNDHVAVTGHPKFDATVVADDALCEDYLLQAGGRKILLWTPHFSVGSPATWSTYKLYSEYIFSEINRRDDVFLLLRPHPMFFKAMIQHGVWDESGEKDFRENIESSKKMTIDEGPDHNISFSVSDALMTDVGSFMLEYLPSGKPLLYLNHPDGLGMNDDGDLVRWLYSASSNDEINEFIDMVSANEDPLKVERQAILPEFLYGMGTNIGEGICEHIHAALSTANFKTPSFLQHSFEQTDSEAYWKKSSDSYLAPSEYYQRKDLILSELLAKRSSYGSIIDVGCGDGRYTFLLAEHASNVTGYDISTPLIEQAKKTAEKNNAANVSFEVQEIEAVAPLEKFDLVSCLGVTSCIISETKFLAFIVRLKELSKKGGYLLLIDTLSTVQTQRASDGSGYLAKYRSIDDYRQLFSRRGFILRDEILIKEIPERQLVNKCFLFELQ